MRRLRNAGIMTLLLLGLTGCSGVQQRLGWSEPAYLGDDADDERPLSRLAFWRRHQTDDRDATADIDSASSSTLASNAASDDDERPGLLRRLPLVSRLWKDNDREDSNLSDYPAARYVPSYTSAASMASTSSRPAPVGAATSAPIAPTAPAVAAAVPQPPSITTAQRARQDSDSVNELAVELDGTKDAQAMPAGLPGPQTTTATPPPLSQATSGTLAPPAALDASAQPGAVPPPSMPGANAAQPSAATETIQNLSPTPTRGPTLPSPTVGSGSTTNPASGNEPVVSTPGPAWQTGMSETEWAGSTQSPIMTSMQGSYVSGGCDAGCGCGGKCKTHKLCPFKKHKQHAVTYSSVLPSAQGGIVSSCEGTCKVKKPCFLKTWLHHKSSCKIKGCKGCKKCIYCGEPAAYVSEQSYLVSPQG